MSIELGQNPWLLIFLIFLEIFLVLIPGCIAAHIEKTSLQEQLKDMGFNNKINDLGNFSIKICLGICIGVFFYIISGYILFFFREILIKNFFGSVFLLRADEGSINSTPYRPNLIQLLIVLILQILIIGPCEEGFFRGFMLKKFDKKLKKFYLILISSLLFAIYHVPPFLVPTSTIITYLGYYFTFGILLALIFVKFKNSLIPGSIAHSIFNILIILF